jgi:hypothetical protein
VTNETPKRKRTFVGRKKAPDGFYTARQAREKLGLSEGMFHYYVKQGRIKKVVPTFRKEGFYPKEAIDRMALETAVFYHTNTLEEPQVIARVARTEDVPGIVEVLTSMGWPTTSVEQRAGFYQVNPCIDHVVLSHGKVAGYLTAIPYTLDALADIMSGKRRSWHMTPDDILPYLPNHTYTLYVGIATRQEFHNAKMLSARLIVSFIQFLQRIALEQGIIISRLDGVSNEETGISLSESLGFIKQPAQLGDYANRYAIDIETSDSHFARIYREAVAR